MAGSKLPAGVSVLRRSSRPRTTVLHRGRRGDDTERSSGGSSPHGPDGLSAADVAEREQRGLVNRADERTSRSLGEIARANLLTRFNAILATDVGADPRVRRGAGLVVRFRARGQRTDRHRAGVAGQANPRPPGGAVGAARTRRARRRGARDRGRRRRARRSARDPRRRSARRRRHRLLGRRAGDRRVVAHRRVGTVGQGRRTRTCCRGASSLRAPGGSRRRGSVPIRTPRRLATEARRFTLDAFRARRRDQPDPPARAVGDPARPRRCSRSVSSRCNTSRGATRSRA